MGLGVFIHRSDSIYDDSPAERYQFPVQYLNRVLNCIGSWVVYYEPRRVPDTRGYFALAKVEKVVRDPTTPGMHLALIEPGSYLDFATPVPFNHDGKIVESGLLNDDGAISGRAQSAVRPLSLVDFDRILELGLGDSEPLLPRMEQSAPIYELDEEQAPFTTVQVRDRVGYIGSRIVRDRIFRRVVLRAYDERCAITGLKLINGGGRAEVAAAHIRPVEANGPDIVNNDLALSGTVHWMFDRGLISLSDDLDILVSRQLNDSASVEAFINRSRRAIFPRRASDRPHPAFLKWHRENRFKQ